MGLPVISEILDITPQFLKDHIFILFLAGDTVLSFMFAAFTGVTAENTKGIMGGIITEVVSFLTGVRIIVASWQILFLVILIQSGLAALIFKMLVAAAFKSKG